MKLLHEFHSSFTSGFHVSLQNLTFKKRNESKLSEREIDDDSRVGLTHVNGAELTRHKDNLFYFKFLNENLFNSHFDVFRSVVI